MVVNKPVADRPADEPMIAPGTVDFVGADLNQVLEFYQKLTGRTVLRPGSLQAAGGITLTTAAPMTKQEVVQALHGVLAMNSITMIPVGDKFVKVVPAAQANQEGAPLQRLDSEAYPELGTYVTHVVQLKYVRPSELTPVLTPLAKIQAGILPIDASMVLVLRDYAENIKRMLELIEEIDTMVPSEFVSEVIPIKYAMASDIASALSSLSSGGGVTSSGSSAGRTTGRTTGLSGTTGRLGSMQGTQPGATPFGGMNQPGQPGAQPSLTDRLQQIIKKASTTGTGDIMVLGPTKIVADERANSLLVFASRQDMDTITNIVSKLDVVLAQVLIEAIIMDVQLTDGQSLGVSYLQKPQQVGKNFLGVGALNNVGFLSGAAIQAATNLGSGLSYFGQFQDFDATVTAAASDSRITVIQKPRIMTFHAKPASFFIGNTVPYVQSTYYGGYGYGGYPSSSYQQLRVGIQLDVTPYINQDGLVVMEINQQIEEISGSTEIANVGKIPNTASRSLNAQLAVKDRETIILGGFIRTSNQKDKSGVPYLKDIPLLGYLFNKTDHNSERKELMVLMRPTVLRTPELAAQATAEDKLRLPGISTAELEDKRIEDRTAIRMKQQYDEEMERQRKEEARRKKSK